MNINAFNFDNFIGILSTRCGSTAVKKAFLRKLGESDSNPHTSQLIRSRELTLSQVAQEKGQTPIVATARLPLDRIVSTYKFNVKQRYWKRLGDYGITPSDTFTEFVDKLIKVDPYKTDIHLKPFYVTMFYKGVFLPDAVVSADKLNRLSQFGLNVFKENESPPFDVEITQEDMEKIVKYYQKDYQLLMRL